MMSYYKLIIISSSFLLAISCRQVLRVESIQEIKEYSSGSGISFFNGRIYLIGDDVNHVLITDTAFKAVDTIQLDSGLYRIPKNIKPDLESSTILRSRKTARLLLLGSGSLEPYRIKGWLINLLNNEKTFLNLDTFYKRVRFNGIKDLNIEGLAVIPGGIILANRGNKSNPRNHLVFTSGNFWNNQESAEIRIMKIGVNRDTSSFNGVSGLEYSYRSDCLILTVSTENTYSTRNDGSIGKSYLWLINNFLSKRRMAAINPDRIIDLDSLDDRFKGHKIESGCIVSENKNEYQLVLVADDDKGTSTLFKIRLNKKE